MSTVRCEDLNATVLDYTARGWKLERISPADDPRVATVFREGERVRLERTSERRGRRGEWVEGRAGMRYRDLVPDRLGGKLIASHIRIDDAGPVPDYVHFHDVAFQMIYCKAGWVKVVYEDQGKPFVLRAGDCVLQPPKIRHRVLECSAGLEVIEVGSPAHHDTFAEHAMTLPTPTVNADRDWEGQRFVRHELAKASWRPWRGYEVRDLGIAQATRGRFGADVLRGQIAVDARPHGRSTFYFVLGGSATIAGRALGPGEAIAIPEDAHYTLSADGELLTVGV